MKIRLVIGFLIGISLNAQDYKTNIYESYVSGDMDAWKKIMADMETAWKSSRNVALLYDLAETQYGYIGYCISMKKKKESKEFLAKAERNTDLFLTIDNRNAGIYAMKGAFFGFRIFLEPLKAPKYGKESLEYNEKALELDPDNAHAWLEKANMEYYRPVVFGGSKIRAVPHYEKAVSLYEADQERSENYWMYLNALAALANAYSETGSLRQADLLYKRILRIEPGFKWIRDEVYPAFKKNHPDI